MPKKAKSLKYYEAVGRRKESRARVRLYILDKEKVVTIDGNKIKAGEIYLNSKPIGETFVQEYEKLQYLKPLTLTSNLARFAISILSEGGGKTGQLEAIVHGLARSLDKVDKDAYHTTLKKQKLLTRDPRTRERRKVGHAGRARRAKQSPKR